MAGLASVTAVTEGPRGHPPRVSAREHRCPRSNSFLMMRAVRNGAVLAESDDTLVEEGNHCHSAGIACRKVLRHERAPVGVPWKGVASYRSLSVDGVVNPDAAWAYDSPQSSHAISRDGSRSGAESR